MNIFKKILISTLCLLILLTNNYYCKASGFPSRKFLDLLSIQEQIDALYFCINYSKINSKIPITSETAVLPYHINAKNMIQWRDSLFQYIKNLTYEKQSIFFCCIYDYINPQSNIMLCAPPNTITQFHIHLIRNIVSYDSSPTVIIAYLTYGRIKTAKIII